MTLKEKIHNKLARDKILAILDAKGITYSTRILNDEDYAHFLLMKLQEEAFEVVQAETRDERLEEMADVLEVLHTLMKLNNCTLAEVEIIRLEKFEQRGGFETRLFLEKTYG